MTTPGRLEERLKRLEAASDLAKARMAKGVSRADQASGGPRTGNSKEAAEAAKAGAGILHELARQVKGEIAREAAEELAMARDLADELADREAELAKHARFGRVARPERPIVFEPAPKREYRIPRKDRQPTGRRRPALLTDAERLERWLKPHLRWKTGSNNSISAGKARPPKPPAISSRREPLPK